MSEAFSAADAASNYKPEQPAHRQAADVVFRAGAGLAGADIWRGVGEVIGAAPNCACVNPCL